MRFLVCTLLFCAFCSMNYAQTNNDYSEVKYKNRIELNQQSLYKQNRLKINYCFLKPNRIHPKSAKSIGHLLQGVGVFISSSALTMGFILHRFEALGTEDYYAFVGIFVAGGAVFYAGTRIVISSKRRIREDLMGMKNTSLFLENQSINLFNSRSSPSIGISFGF